MRIKHKVNPRISEDSAGKDMLFGLDDALAEVTIDTHTHQVNGHFSVAVGATEALSFGDVAVVRGAYLEVGADCSLYLNGSLDAILIKLAPGAAKAKFFIEATLTQVQLKATGAVALTGKACFWGDPTP